MKRSLVPLSLLSLICVLFFAYAVIAAESIRYDFDEVEVVYAAEFTIKPKSTDADNWLVQLAGGTDKSVTVLYGVVNLKRGGYTGAVEEFIKVSGVGDSERFLMNSGRWDYYEGTGKLKHAATFFWSAKKLIGDSVVKDFTPPIKSLSFYRKFDENQNIEAIVLTASNDGQKAAEEFWSYDPFTTTTTTTTTIPTPTTTIKPPERTTTTTTEKPTTTTAPTTTTTTTTLPTTTIPLTTTIPEVPVTTTTLTTTTLETTTSIQKTTTTTQETTQENTTFTIEEPGVLELTLNTYEADMGTFLHTGIMTARAEEVAK